MKCQYTLVLQFPKKSMEFGEMIELGDSIAKHLQDKKDESLFDGHDIGSGQIDFSFTLTIHKILFLKVQARY